jgi:hypothetical protein
VVPAGVGQQPSNSLIILVFFQPCHLYGLELSFGGRHRIILEIRQIGDPFMEVREAHVCRVHIGMGLEQTQSDIFGMIPGQSRHGFIVGDQSWSYQN